MRVMMATIIIIIIINIITIVVVVVTIVIVITTIIASPSSICFSTIEARRKLARFERSRMEIALDKLSVDRELLGF